MKAPVSPRTKTLTVAYIHFCAPFLSCQLAPIRLSLS